MMNDEVENQTAKLKVLLTGPSGRVGPALVAAFAPVYELRVLDLKPFVPSWADTRRQADEAQLFNSPLVPEIVSFVGDLLDIDVLRTAMRGVDVVVHLAATSDDAPFVEQLLMPNVAGVYNAHEAARLEGVRRIVYASSVQASSGKGRASPTETDELPRPYNMYGVTKVFGETMGRMFHARHGMEWVGIRIGSWLPPGDPKITSKTVHRSIWLSPRDGASLFRRAIEHPDVGYALVNGTSRVENGRLSLQSARDLLGWEPQDELPELKMQ